MNTLNIELTKRTASEAYNATCTLKNVFEMTKHVPEYILSSVCSNDFDMRHAMADKPNGVHAILNGVTHAAWSKWLTEHNAWHLLLNNERELAYTLTFYDTYKRSLFRNVKTLVPFTVEAATEFFNAHLVVTAERRAKYLNDVLDRTGKDYRSHCTEFKAKMSLRSLDHGYGTVSNELARALYAVCLHLDIDFSFNSFYTELRNNARVNGESYPLVEGLDMFFENHANGNTTVRIGKDLVARLNLLIATGVTHIAEGE